MAAPAPGFRALIDHRDPAADVAELQDELVEALAELGVPFRLGE